MYYAYKLRMLVLAALVLVQSEFSLAAGIHISHVNYGASWTRLRDGTWEKHLPNASMSGTPMITVYDNTTNFQGAVFTQGPAAGTPTFTRLVADDLSLTADGLIGADVREVGFSVYNGNASTISFRPLVRFYRVDGAGGAPGTLMNGFTMDPISVAANTFTMVLFDPGAGVLTVPSDQKVWAGVTFDNVGGTATAAQMSNVGQALFDPPTVGASDDIAFETTNAGSFLMNNPPGALFNFGEPLLPPARASFSVVMRVADPAAPEPTFPLLAILGLLGVRGRRHR